MTATELPTYLKSIRYSICPDGMRFEGEHVNAGLNRLFTYQDALIAWDKLYKMDIILDECGTLNDEDLQAIRYLKALSKEDLWSLMVGMEFFSIFRECFLDDNQRLTKSEIKKSADSVYKKARELAHLINDNFALVEIQLRDCMSEPERHAFAKIGDYLRSNYDAVKAFDPSFSARDYLAIVHHNNILTQDLRDILWSFADNAKSKSNIEPIKTKPKTKDTEARIFCERFCEMSVSNYGKPNTDIACSFASAIFDKSYSNDTVKSWWDRCKT